MHIYTDQMLTVSLSLLTAIQPTLQPRDAPGTKLTHLPLCQ